LSILAESPDPFKDVPGKYWDLSPSGQNPPAIVDLDKVFISIEERQFTDGKHYIIRPRFLHPSRDTSWLLSVDPMTALECIRRRLGPHTIDISNFLISHGVRFRALQRIPNSEKLEAPVRPRSRYLGNRSFDYSFDLADYSGYEVLRDSFLRSQSHGPLALREGGIIARLAREVLPNSNALSGPSSEALSGHHARYTYGDEIYVDDRFLDEELELICGTYVLEKHGVQSKKVSWFPPANIWNFCGYNVGQWTEECEKWFQGHVSNIHSGKFQPLSSRDWRQTIRNTRSAVKLTYQMRKGAAGFISAYHDQLSR